MGKIFKANIQICVARLLLLFTDRVNSPSSSEIMPGRIIVSMPSPEYCTLLKTLYMNKDGPIIIIEDDEDDRMLLTLVFQELNFVNEVCYFKDGISALEYLQDDNIYPFVILSDINLPKLNGFELRKMVHTNEGLSSKCIPYLFFSTAVDKKAVYDAYTMSVQGFFLKPNNYERLKHTVKVIIEYWKECYSPNNYPQT